MEELLLAISRLPPNAIGNDEAGVSRPMTRPPSLLGPICFCLAYCHQCLFSGEKLPVWKGFPQAPTCPLFRIYVSLMLHCAALLVRLSGLVLFGPLFFSLLTQFTSDSLGGHFPSLLFPSTRKDLVLKSRRHRFHGLFL